MSSLERTGWRDAGLSLRHRIWGHNCPMIDLDFICAEYDNCQPVAMIEYKQTGSGAQDFTKSNWRTFVNAADRMGVPGFYIQYTPDYSSFLVFPLNDMAKSWCLGRTKLSEVQYVTFLYRLRGRVVPEEVLLKLHMAEVA